MPLHTKIQEDFEGFGRVLVLENGRMEARITLDVGPRVISLSLPGRANLFFTDTDDVLAARAPEIERAFGPGQVYHFFGGHRLWMSPELLGTTYCPDNDPVTLTLLPDGALVTPPPQLKNGLQFSLSLTMAENAAAARVEHVIENIGESPARLAPWAITQLAPGGVMVIPQPKKETGLLADRLMAVWPYTDMGDRRVNWGDDAILLRQDAACERFFKIGLNNRAGWALYQLGDQAFAKTFSYEEDAVYPDGGMNFETYTNQLFIEMESLGPICELAPGEKTVLREEWRVFDRTGADAPADPDAGLRLARSLL